jgi:hypothetical protein
LTPAASVSITTSVTNFKIFVRYNDSPPGSTSRSRLAEVNATIRNVKTLTLGATEVFGRKMDNEIHFNVTGNNYKPVRTLDNFGAATPLDLTGVRGALRRNWTTV